MILGLAAIICIIIFVAFNKVRDDNIRTLNAVATLKNCENMAKLLCDNVNYSQYKDALNKMYEDIKYCNSSVIVDIDVILVDKLLDLEKKLSAEEKTDENIIYNAIEDIRYIIKKEI